MSARLTASGITYRYSQMQRLYRATGEQVEGAGIGPDVWVDPDAADLAAGIDTQIAAAIDWLRKTGSRSTGPLRSFVCGRSRYNPAQGSGDSHR